AESSSYLATQAGTYYVEVFNRNFCTNTSDTVYLAFDSVPTASIAALDTFYCITASAVTPSGTPAGGTFLLDNDTVSTFDPATAGLGLHTVSYNYTTAQV